jgi:hypothetical protein
MNNEDNEPEYAVYETTRFLVEEGFYSIEYLEELVKNLKDAKAVQDQHLLQSMVTRRMIHLTPKREWVGLTDEEKDRITSLTATSGRLSAINLTEKFLKEKNT